MVIKDITLFSSDDTDSTRTVTGSSAIAVAIRNILLSEEGVFVNFPDLDLSISKILFDQIGDDELYQLKNAIFKEIVKKIPTLAGVILDVKKIELKEANVEGATAIGISIMQQNADDSYDLLVFKKEGNVFVI